MRAGSKFLREAIPNDGGAEAIWKTKSDRAMHRVVTEHLRFALRIFDSFLSNPRSA